MVTLKNGSTVVTLCKWLSDEAGISFMDAAALVLKVLKQDPQNARDAIAKWEKFIEVLNDIKITDSKDIDTLNGHLPELKKAVDSVGNLEVEVYETVLANVTEQDKCDSKVTDEFQKLVLSEGGRQSVFEKNLWAIYTTKPARKPKNTDAAKK